MKIEEYREEEQEQIAELIQEIFKELGFPFDKETTHKDLFDIKNHFTNFFVIRTEEGVVGTVGIKIEEGGDLAGIKRLYLKKDYRGKGWGRALLEMIIDFAKEKGVERVWLRTTERNVQALKIYKKNGFTESKREDNYIYLEKEIRD